MSSVPQRRRLRESLGHGASIVVLFAAASGLALDGSASPRNVASSGVVTTSSRCGIEPSGQPGPVGPERLIDGRRARFYDHCTNVEGAPWVRLDLTREQRVDRVLVHGRADCCWEHMGLPLVAEVSKDGATFEPLAQRSLPFTRDEPWAIAFPARPVKSLRLRSLGRGNIVLSEMEVLAAE